ncbi:ATP-dependent metallopeptidase HflB [Marvinbryantia formatexigens DSM 14469]|uniref:ATP-dependent zinc metalloprotease FtsH n=1 Tax=Marvinbryantia formatexigens DSM 14469 TaxID=478749 RepID=C6LHU4_9FIRM|nr:ATP-dependent zinc metalloprotease FtsH [Marvinbryantia formatexigens]EET59834.1 ATP-dependent metallopeptidase HflB [Marvinbryantia formatexigens DSM 14469]UWO23308.1 ATP-dependent zinc metalloprotease FtsH [Marvinbryantia formatexigens DSM 14469]SDG42162.1 cell division protease FtsH [Marvinbryantia formatexigens]
MDENRNSLPGQKRGSTWIIVIIVFFLITFILNMFSLSRTSVGQIQISYDQFLDLVEGDVVEQVYMDDDQIQIYLKDGVEETDVVMILGDGDNWENIPETQSMSFRTVVFYTGRVEDSNLSNFLRENGVHYSKEIPEQTSVFSAIASWILPIAIMYLLYFLVMKAMMKRMGGGIGGFMGGMGGNIGKSKAKVYTVEKSTGVTFRDVAGQDEAKESLEEMVDYLKNPEKYRAIGAQQPKGALLVGPPGTGKTLLAKAVAGEAGVPFYHLTGSEFVEMFVGVGASRVRDLFQTAKKNTPCIIFIDEIDAIGKKRDNQLGSNDEREQTLNQLLAEMDGFETNGGIIVLAATNRPEILDQALLRPGRFDRRIIVEKPDLPGRESILRVHGKKVSLSSDVDFHAIALATSGASGADLANIVNEAALRAVRIGRNVVVQEDLMESVETVIAGKEKKDRVLNSKERQMVAYHEVGHALVAALQKNAQPVQKITIIPRTMGALGYTMNAPEEERYLLTADELLAQITSLLGGRAAEIVKFGISTTGASNDIERATEQARKMVTQYGMSERFGSMGLQSTQNQYLDGRNVSTCSEQTGAEADEEVRKIIERCQDKAVKLLRENLEALDRIATRLLEKESISGKELMELIEK